MLIGIGASIYSGNRYDAAISSANLAARFDAALGITSAGGFVSAWSDQSGNGRNLLQASGANQPAYDTTGGVPSLIFNGTSHFMKTAPFTLNQPESIYVVAKQLSWTDADYFFDGGSSNTGVLFQFTATPQLSIFAGSVAGSDTNLSVGSKGVVAVVFNGAASSLQVNQNSSATINPGAANMGGFTLASNGIAVPVNNWSNIQVYEVLIYAAAHDAATRANIIRALMSKHGVA